MSAFLHVENLSYAAGKRTILHDISFSAGLEKVTAFLGPNGAGKTTLLKAVTGLYQAPKPTVEKNSISLNGNIINSWAIHKRIAEGLVYLPQHPSIFQQMSVSENLDLVYHYHHTWHKKSKHEFNTQRDDWFEKISLTTPLTQQAGTLSGGQKRKLEVIRSLLMHPKMIMLDEPFAGVDPKSIYELKTIFKNMATQHGMGVIISDHYVDQLLSIADKVYVIIDGKVVTSGSIQDILKSNATKESYLGNQFYQEMSHRYL